MASDQSMETETKGPQRKRLATRSGSQLMDHPKCGYVADLVNLAELRICGPNRVGTAAFAEGLARLGQRSASRLGDVWPPAGAAMDSVPCVYHGFSDGNFSVPNPASVVLVAGTHQDAVDQCLIAQWIAGDLGVPVHCLADSALQECLGCVELPQATTFESHPPGTRSPQSVTSRNLVRCFEAASTGLDRDHLPVMPFGPKRARQVVIACGRQAALARMLIDQGCFSVETRLLDVRLLRPLPHAELVRHLQESETLIVLTRADNAVDAELLVALEILAAGDRDFPKICHLPLPEQPRTSDDLLNALPPSLVDKSSAKIFPTPVASLQLQIGVSPGGPWSQNLLFESASTIIRSMSPANNRDAFHVTFNRAARSTFSWVSIGDQKSSALDLLVYTENNLVDADDAVEALTNTGVLVVHSETADIAAAWQALSPKSQQLILEKNIETWWICPGDLLEPGSENDDSSCEVLSGALLKALSAKLDLGSSVVEAAPLSPLERAGFQAIGKFDPANPAEGTGETPDDSAANATTEPGQVPGQEKDWRQALRAFHLTGRGAYNDLEPLPGLPLWPALATKLVDEHRLAARYPLVVPSSAETGDTEPVSLIDILASASADADGEQAGATEETVRELERMIEESPLDEGSTILATVLKQISDDDGNEINEAGRLDRFRHLLESGRLVDFGPETLPVLYAWAMAARRQDVKHRFVKEVEELIDGLQNLLRADLLHRGKEQSPESLAATMGEEAIAFVDLEKLSQNLPRVTGSKTLSDSLRDLIRQTVEVLQSFHDSESRSLLFYQISSGEETEFPDLPASARFVIKGDCFEAALGIVNGLLERMAGVFRAARVARLLIAGRYRPELHDEVFSRFEWQSCNDEEILLVPTVLVVESAAQIRLKKLAASLSRLLQAGRPAHILITQDESGVAADQLSGALADLGAMAMAHREAFVLQSTLARPDHLLAGIREMARAVRPALALVTSHGESQHAPWAWASELVSHHGRVAPCFMYSPERGPSWSNRMDLWGNPQLEAGQPTVNFSSTSLPEAAQQIDEIATFAHAAALRSEFRSHFRVIPSSAWSDEQEPIGAYLDKFQSTPPATLPYIWIVRKKVLYRAIITREMANACRDRSCAWRNLQELAGINNEVASRTREEVLHEMEARYQDETENARAQGRQEGMVQAVNRIVQALLSPPPPNTTAENGEGGSALPPGEVTASTKPSKTD